MTISRSRWSVGKAIIIGVNGTWDAVLELYRQWILTQLGILRGKRPGCYCKPLACHGDSLIQLLEEKYGKEI